MRGTIVGSMQLFNQVGQITAAGVNRAFYQSTKRSGYVHKQLVCFQEIGTDPTRRWLVPVCVQLICPFVVVFGLFIVRTYRRTTQSVPHNIVDSGLID